MIRSERNVHFSHAASSALASAVCTLGLILTGCASGSTGDREHVSWRDASDRAGDIVTVCGPLKGIGNDGDDKFLNVGAPYPEEPRFTIVVWDHPDSVQNVDPTAVDYRACVTGEVSMYQGMPQVELDDGSDIELTRR